MENLFNIVNRIGKKFDNDSTWEIYTKLTTDKFLYEICKAIGPLNTVYLVFLIKGFKEGRELQDVMNRCKEDLFTFSYIEVSSEDYEETCSTCGGDGIENCHNCGGNGNVDCDDCGGSGEDDEGENCSNCDGSGLIDCDYCEREGTISCEDCDGSGEVTSHDTVSITIHFMASIDKEVRNKVELLDTLEEISSNTERFFKLDGYTLSLFSNDDTSTNYKIYDSGGETLFGEYNTEPDFKFLKSRNFITDSNLELNY